jgi:AcrR family transcriptional regulator
MSTIVASDTDTGTDTGTTEARVLAAALSCIARFGPSKTTLDDIARESGVSRATIYRAFPGGRDTLFDAVLAREVERFFAELRVVLDGCDDLEDLLVAGLGGAMRFLLDHQALHSIVSLEPVLLVPQLVFHRLDTVLGLASAFAAPYLEPHLGPADDAAGAADHLVRVVLSYALNPGDRVDPHDEASIRRLVRRHVLPGIAPVGGEPRPAPAPSATTTNEEAP